MKKTIFIIFSLLLSTISIYAQTWEFVGLDSLVVKQIYVSGDTIWAGTSHRVGNQDKSGLYKSIDGGKYWFGLDSSLGIGHVSFLYVDELNTNIIYIIKGISVYGNAGIFYRTTDGGESWYVAQNITQNVIKWIGISPFNKSEIYFISDGFINILYRSTDGGENWEEIGSFPSDSHGNRVTVALDLLRDSTLYAGVSTDLLGDFFYKSTNRGDSWIFVSEPPVGTAETRSDLFLLGRIYLFAQYKATDDGGFNWYAFDSGLPNQQNYLSFYMNANYPNKLFNLRRDGLYVTKNDSINWQLIEDSETLPLNVGSGGFNFGDVGQMINLFIEVESNQFYVGTAQGIYKSNLITNIQEEINNAEFNFHLEQNYPNPFNPNTKIVFTIPSNLPDGKTGVKRETSNVTLKVYDILGKEVATLVNEELEAGKYEIDFIVRDLSSGIYFYTFRSGSFVKTKKMVLIK